MRSMVRWAGAALALASVSPGLADPLVQRGGALSLKVADFDVARQRMREAAERVGGQVTGVQVQVTEKGRRHGWVRVAIPREKIAAFAADARAAGILYGERLGASDRTSEYEELARRADRLHIHQRRLDALLQSRRRLRGSDILYVQERLFRAEVDEEMLRQRRIDLERRGQSSLLVVTLFEPVPTSRRARLTRDLRAAFAGGVGRAQEIGSVLGGRAATALGIALTLSPLWLPVTLTVVWLWRALWRRRRR